MALGSSCVGAVTLPPFGTKQTRIPAAIRQRTAILATKWRLLNEFEYAMKAGDLHGVDASTYAGDNDISLFLDLSLQPRLVQSEYYHIKAGVALSHSADVATSEQTEFTPKR